ncbi:MAG: SRPBCC family protein [Acidimicrobiales bacterium]
MAHYETTIDSPLSAAAAFERLSDVTRFVEWDPGVLAAKQVEGNGPGPDAAYELSVKGFVGNSLDLRYDVVEFAEPSLLHLWPSRRCCGPTTLSPSSTRPPGRRSRMLPIST